MQAGMGLNEESGATAGVRPFAGVSDGSLSAVRGADRH